MAITFTVILPMHLMMSVLCMYVMYVLVFIMSDNIILWLNKLAMKGGIGSIPACSEFWLNVVLVVNQRC